VFHSLFATNDQKTGQSKLACYRRPWS
jgi:hypothetical protein